MTIQEDFTGFLDVVDYLVSPLQFKFHMINSEKLSSSLLLAIIVALETLIEKKTYLLFRSFLFFPLLGSSYSNNEAKEKGREMLNISVLSWE